MFIWKSRHHLSQNLENASFKWIRNLPFWCKCHGNLYNIYCEEKGIATSKFGSWWIKCEFMDVKSPNCDFNYTNHLISPFPRIHPFPCAFRSIHCPISLNSCISLVFENLLFKIFFEGFIRNCNYRPPP